MSYYSAVEAYSAISSSTARLRAMGENRLDFPADLDLCRDRLPAGMDRDALRFAAEARKSTSRQAFKPAFLPEDWRIFASFCVTRRLPAGYRVLVPGSRDSTLRFVIEGSLRQEAAGGRITTLVPGTIVGEDTVFGEASGELDVRALEASQVLELTLPRRNELTASYPALAFALLRAAGAVIAGRLQ